MSVRKLSSAIGVGLSILFSSGTVEAANVPEDIEDEGRLGPPGLLGPEELDEVDPENLDARMEVSVRYRVRHGQEVQLAVFNRQVA